MKGTHMKNHYFERKLRHALSKQGYQLCKSRAKNWSLNNQLGYMIIDPYYNIVVRGPQFDLTLEEVSEFVYS